MASFAPVVDVQNRSGDVQGHHFRRVAGWLDDQRTVAIATLVMGEEEANIELQFDLAEAHQLALAALSGDRRALTTPGLARKLSATVAILFRVCLASGGLQEIGVGNDGGSDGDESDRGAAGDDEPADNAALLGSGV